MNGPSPFDDGDGFSAKRHRRRVQPRASREHVGYWYPKNASTYRNHGCRCPECTAAWAEYRRDQRAKEAAS